MGMQIEKSFVINAARATVWEFLTDPRRVAGCLPGAAITGELEGGAYTGTITVKVGPVTASYRGKMRFERLDAAAGEAEIVASGQETRGKGGADMRMKSRVAERPGGATEVTVTSDVNVMGTLAQFGRGMIQDVSDQLFQRFTDCMRRELEVPAAAAAPAPPSPSPETASAAAAEPAPPEPARMAPLPPAAGEAALDLGSLGAAAAARAAGRTARRPGFWIAAIVILLLLLWFFLG